MAGDGGEVRGREMMGEEVKRSEDGRAGEVRGTEWSGVAEW
jgi:hypothetical protein